jgi:hypothetical protein
VFFSTPRLLDFARPGRLALSPYRRTATIAHHFHRILGDSRTVPGYLFREDMTEIEE